MKPSWTDMERWARLVDGSECPFCQHGPTGVVAELSGAWVTTSSEVAVRGYCCVIPRAHAIELHALDSEDAAALMRDVQHVAKATQEITGAIKLNYEIHGNVVPHVHVHIIPRYPDDAIERSGVGFARLTDSPYRPGEFDSFREALAEKLKVRSNSNEP